jgi:hypothetical protein
MKQLWSPHAIALKLNSKVITTTTTPITTTTTTTITTTTQRHIMLRIAITELYKRNRERHRFLGYKAENQECFVAFVVPSGGIILALTPYTI